MAKVQCSESGCWEWTGTKIKIGKSGRGGYGTIGLGAASLGKGYVHRVSYELHIGKIPAGMFVLHRCDNRLCVNPDHLFLGTAKDNALDAVAKRRMAYGDRSGSAKLTQPNVDDIRNRIASGESQSSIAARFGVSQSQISNINRGRSWSLAGSPSGG